MRILLGLVLLISAIGCYSRRYFRVPPTDIAEWCLKSCLNDQSRCVELPGPMVSCQQHADTCIAMCPDAVEVSYAEWLEPDAGS